MVQLDNQLTKIAQYKLVGVSIITCGALGYDMTGGGSAIEFDATVSYHYWTRS